MTWYLKYRPQKLAQLDLIAVRQTLGNILKSGKSAHAFLFTGPRGVGKTSAARIVAKSLNCPRAKQGEPCGKCDICQSIETGSAVDVVEIDAASNRGIDEIRELRERIKLAPMQLKYKVYIIDEVHMLTLEAANALLKTLEEPPAHTVFILCTTDPQRLPETVISRCSQVQFNRPTVAEIVAKLQQVAKQEKAATTATALRAIAGAAKGSFRDAIKILEQVWLTAGDAGEEAVKRELGLWESADPGRFLQLVRSGQTQPALELVNAAVEQGVNPRSFIERTVEQLREELLATRDRRLIEMVLKLDEAYERSKTSSVPQLPLEIFVIEMAGPKPEPTDTLSTAPPRAVGGRPAPSLNQPPSPDSKAGHKAKGKYKLEDITSRWSEVLKVVKPKNHSVEALLRSTRPIEFDGHGLTLEVFYKFHRDKLASEKCRVIIEDAVTQIMGVDGIVLDLKLGEKNRRPEEISAQVEDDIVEAAENIFKVDAI